MVGLEAYGKLSNEYARRYAGCKKSRVWDAPALIALCTDSPNDDYRRAMWQRRAWLHRNGRHGDVYDGADAIRWARQMERERLLTEAEHAARAQRGLRALAALKRAKHGTA